LSDYTPTTEEVRSAALSDDWGSGIFPEDFDCWFAEELRKAKAEAWDEAGLDLHGNDYEETEMYLRNPYRQGEN
jgi:hypothetical protein